MTLPNMGLCSNMSIYVMTLLLAQDAADIFGLENSESSVATTRKSLRKPEGRPCYLWKAQRSAISTDVLLATLLTKNRVCILLSVGATTQSFNPDTSERKGNNSATFPAVVHWRQFEPFHHASLRQLRCETWAAGLISRVIFMCTTSTIMGLI
jgi:hypothetical protein